VSEASILCLHGIGRSSVDWADVTGELGQLGEVSTPSLPARSDRALDVAAQLTTPETVVIGHSGGGLLALRLAGDRGLALRGLVLTSSFFPPALNGRSVETAVGDYLRHRVAFVRDSRSRRTDPGERSAGAAGLASLASTAIRPRTFRRWADELSVPVLVVHARDDHYVPVDFAIAACSGRPGWTLNLLETGGHYPHRDTPSAWLESVGPWLRHLVGGS
jgi:pimeloyl-ACP methyl ester carboxylesterase